MTLAELEAAARNAQVLREELRRQHPGVWDRPAELQLLLKRNEPKGHVTRVRLAGRKGPFGEFICSPRDGEVLAVFDAQAVIDWCRRELRRG